MTTESRQTSRIPTPAWYPGVRRLFVDGQFGQHHVRIVEPALAEQKRPLVCFHLSPGSGRMYSALLVEMGRDRVAIAPDTPGFGESEPPPTPPTIGDYAAAADTLLDRLGIGEVDVMGYHTGSKVCVELARRRPDRVKHLVLVSAPIYTEEELARQRLSMGNPEPLLEDGSHLLRRWNGLYGFRSPGQTLELLQRELAETLRGGEISWWGHNAAFSYHHAENLPKVEQPVMVLCPDDDLVAPTRRAKDYIRNGRLVELPGKGHGMLDIHTAEIGGILREFLDEG